jgi:hypothetical protein
VARTLLLCILGNCLSNFIQLPTEQSCTDSHKSHSPWTITVYPEHGYLAAKTTSLSTSQIYSF